MTAATRPIPRRPRQGGQFARTDWGLLLIVLMMLIIGLAMVYSASYGFSLQQGGMYEGQPAFFFRRQLVSLAVGLVAMAILWRIDYRWYRRLATLILAITMAILVTMAILGRWVFHQRMASFIQPVEVAKVGAMIYIAVWLASRGERIRDISLGLIPFSLLLGIMAGLVVIQPDFSTAIVLIATATAMFFVAGADMRQLLIGFLCGGIALVMVAFLAPYRVERIRTFFNDPLTTALSEGFQTVQSLAALNAGGLFGVGLGQSQQKFSIFAPHTDGMFAIIGEELGFVGASLVLLLYGLWTWRGLRVARQAEDRYGMLLAVGLVCWVTFQATLHVGVITATTPFTGTVLPMVSYGGSSLTTTLGSIGILLSISRGSTPTDHGPAGIGGP
jgi:cell division protein FtsW